MSPPQRQSVARIAEELERLRAQDQREIKQLKKELTRKERALAEAAALLLVARAHRHGRARPPQEPREVPRLKADGPIEVWSWEITYLPTSVPGVWLYLYRVIDVWSRKSEAWDVADREDSQITADLVSRLEELGVLRSILRPRVSNDNPYSESLFRTV
jgi:transposase InsO family protein